MKIEEIVWLEEVVDKIARKHHVTSEEVEELFERNPKIRFLEEGDIMGENMYIASGKTFAGRYLTVIFIYKKTKNALIITARDMTKKEQRQYGKK